ncbi:DUF7344 domain-containing protein [Halosimplex salinum]|uniref:DUF7344 domain-containing protein n=1 Tax=Halosimplex salinum TaxID=1710538 RepID=UPI0013DE1BB1|nr:hypothetical protein [Halosimplex salinum]
MESADCYPEKAEMADTIFEDLSHHVRREIINFFENFNDGHSAPLNDLVAHISARMPDRDREKLILSLFHRHLPTLQSTGWIDFDQRSEEIRYYGHESVPELLHEAMAMFTE